MNNNQLIDALLISLFIGVPLLIVSVIDKMCGMDNHFRELWKEMKKEGDE